MRFGMRRSGVVAAALTSIAVGGAVLTPAAAQADTLPAPAAVTVTVTDSAIRLSTGTTHQAGRILFTVVAKGREHQLQLLSLVPGYSLAQAEKDVAAALESNGPPDLDALHRIDHNIHWLGGAVAAPGQNGRFAKTLYRGTYYAVDTEGSAVTKLTVTGTAQQSQAPASSSVITGTRDDRFLSPSTLPSMGWTIFRDTSDEPHFLVLQQVKPSTTNKDVQDYINSGGQGEPSFLLPAGTSTGVISGGTQMYFHYDLPAGKYLEACFWPDDQTGMPHFFMGMWKLVNLTPTS